MNKTWNVFVGKHFAGTVEEETEALARCAALSKFGIPDDEEFIDVDDPRCIRSDDEFSVSNA